MPAVPSAKSGPRPVRKSRLLVLLLCLLAALAAFFLLETARAQEGTEYDYVDLLITYGYDRTAVSYSVLNSGTATATEVTVEFLLEDLQADTNDPPDVSDQRIVESTNQAFTWNIGTILPGESSPALEFSTELHSGHTTPNRIGVITATAKALQPEPGNLSANNVIKVYSFAYRTGIASSLHMEGNRLGLLLSVDDLAPAVGADLNFDLTARNFNVTQAAASDFINLIDDIEIKVELSNGLQFKTGWNPDKVTVAPDGQSATWEPDAVDTRGDVSPQIRPASRELADIQTQLTSDSLTDIPLEDRCITAWVADSTPAPSADYVLGSLTECLGDDPPVLLEEGSVAFLTSFPCIDDTHTDAHQCESVPGVAVAGRLPSRYEGYVESDDFDANLRSHSVGRTDEHIGGLQRSVFLDPESVVIQVKDPAGRVQDSHTQSVSAVSWQTARPAITNMNRAVDGVSIAYTRKDIKDASAWNSLGPRTLTVSRADGATPGKVKIRFLTNGNTFFDFSSTSTVTKSAFSITSTQTTEFAYFAEFETLGTYLVKYDLTMTDSSSDDYTDTGTYTFHVGPIAELEVRDVGASSDVPSTQRAFTIVAVNNGPDVAPAAEVTLTGLDATTCTGTATKGELEFASSDCTWTIGELKAKEASQIDNGRDGEILTIITTADVDSEITAEIENDQDYQVCIDSDGDDVTLTSPSSSACTTEDATNTWHTTPYYDYNDDNDSATIKAKDGTGADLPSLQSAVENTASITVTWDPITEVYGRGVTHYEVQRETNPWVTVADDVTGTQYIDTNVKAGDTYRYRVRAVNDWDHKGPWSQPMEGTVMVPDIPAPGAPTDLRATPLSSTEIFVTWDTPTGATVKHYQLHAASDDGFTTDLLDVVNNPGNSYSHRGLEAGTTWYYRVRAVNSEDEEGQWSATVNEQTDTDEDPQPEIRTVIQERVVTETETVAVPEPAFAYFSPTEVTRSVMENSAGGSPVGAPVAVIRNSGNSVAYSLEGDDAALFSIEADTGQILVGQDTVLDYESGTTSYSVEVVADPSSGDDVRATVTINVVDVVENATVAITPAGQPEVDTELTATLTHEGGDPTDPTWQWQRSTNGRLWLNIAGATDSTYKPTEQDAGHMLRAIVIYGEPSGDGHGVATMVTEALAGEAPGETPALSATAALYDANGDGSIDLDETLAAIADYFSEDLDSNGVLEVINAYFAG